MEKSGLKPMEILFPGRVTQVIDPHYFWMQMGSAERVACFLKIQRDMQLFCENHWSCVSDADSLVIGQLVLVDTGLSDVRWRRGQVSRISSDSADIFYIDYGHTELSALDRICADFPPIFRSVPPMAVRCCLAGVKPIAKSWTTRGIKTFAKLTTGYTLQTLVIYADIGYLLVSLYGRDSGNPRSISHHLLDEDVALPIEDNEVPEFVSDIPAFLALFPNSPDSHAVSSNCTSGKDTDHISGEGTVSSPTKSSEKYIPPARKQAGSSPGSAARNGPVHDFFPFENVSTYPPTPTESPTKASSIGKGSSPGSSEGSYFSRSPGRDYIQPDYDRIDQNDGSPGRSENGYRRDYNCNSFQQDRSPQKAFKGSESPRNYSNFERGTSQSGLGPGKSRNSDLGGSPKSSNILSGSGLAVNKLQNGSVHTFTPPFFQPKQPVTDVTQMNMKPPTQTSLTPPTAFESHHPNPTLTPPGYYGSQKSSGDDSSQGQRITDYSSTNRSYSGNFNSNSSAGSATAFYSGSYHPGFYNANNDYKTTGRGKSKEGPLRANHSPNNSSYAEEKTKDKPSVKLQMPDTSFPPPLIKSPVSYHTTNALDMARSTPWKSLGSYYSPKPISPESPGIANFDMNDIEHTMNVSTAGLHQRNHQQTLVALQEEADDIAKESKEQMQLVRLSRIGHTGSENYAEEYSEVGAPDVFDRISEEIRDAANKETTQFDEEMKRSPVKRRQPCDSYQKLAEPDKPPKLEEMPQTYLGDIDFAVAVKEALESSKTEGMENTRALLEEIVESLKVARVEKQLYDVIVLLLATAIHDYNLYHLVVMETISKLNDEFDIKDILAKAMKKQQDKHVRVPVGKNPTHVEFSQVMAHVYNMCLGWKDSNSSIQESILNHIERWIMFNNKGSQIGQTDKENVFLDCFTAFWEVASGQLRKHNQSEFTRLQEEVKKKLLNDNVIRSIRERLLNILLDMFRVKESCPSIDMFTQTPRRTMIPSSCQVKPAVCDKGIMTDEEDQVYHDLIFTPGDRFHGTTELVTPEISLRPAKSWTQEYHSTPHADNSANNEDKRLSYTGLRPHSSSCSENSYIEASYSVYETPNESFEDGTLPVSNSISSVNDNVLKTLPQAKPGDDIGLAKSQKETGNIEADKFGKSKPLTSGTGSSKIKEAEVKETCAKASIVDWFEYNPEPEPALKDAMITITKKETSKRSNKSKSHKPCQSLSELAEDFVSHAVVKSNSIPKYEIDISPKHKPNADDKNMKHRHESPKHHESVAEKLAKTSELDQRREKLKTEEKVVTELLNSQNLSHSKKDNKPHSEKISKADPQKDSKAEVKKDRNNVEKESIIHEKLDWWEDSESVKTANCITLEVLGPPVEKNIVNQNDEFGFENEFDDEQWEIHSDSELEDGSLAAACQKPRNYDTDFPQTDLHEPVRPTADYGASSKVVKNDYDKDFPNVDLASYIAPPPPNASEPGARWVPGVRCCTLCGDKGHTANECPDSASKLFF